MSPSAASTGSGHKTSRERTSVPAQLGLLPSDARAHLIPLLVVLCCSSCAALVTLLSGLSSGLLSTLLLQPLDVAKTSLINPEGRSSGMRALFSKINKEQGWKGMWRGVGPALARISIVSCCLASSRMQPAWSRSGAWCNPSCARVCVCVLCRVPGSISPLKLSCSP